MASDPPTSRQVTITIHGTTKTRECLEPWLDDGNVVLLVQEKCFRVHRTILGSYSEVFRDMFAIPHSEDIEEDTIDGCPVIFLQDPVDQIQIMLRAFYDRSFVFSYNTPMPVAVLEAFLCMGKKYNIQQLLEEAKRRLSIDSPPLLCASKLSAAGNTALFPRISGNDPFNFRVMNIAGDAGIFSTVVMAIFYCCLACPATSIVNGYEFQGEKVTLSPSNTQYCFLGQRYLTEVERSMVQTLGYLSEDCERLTHYPRTSSSCSLAILTNLRRFQELKRPFTLWDPAWDKDMCTVCRAGLRKRHEDVRTKLWKSFPTTLGLRPWEELDNESEILDSGPVSPSGSE